jgi:hypothetical protein
MTLFLPVYSRWNPAAETLMSDWKFRYKLLDVLFKRWGIVVPEMKLKKQVTDHKIKTMVELS